MCKCIKLYYYLIAMVMLTSNWAIQAKELLFVSNQDGDREIFTVNIDGKSLKQLTHNNRDDSMAVWSPDGNYIAFTSSRDNGNSEIYIMDADGSNQINLSNSPGYDGNPQWSPDGKSLVFCSDRKLGINLFTINPATSNINQLTTGSNEKTSPKWSPSGEWIAYVGFNDMQKANVYIIKPDGSSLTQLTKNKKGNDDGVSWSTDSTQLAYHSRRNRTFNIYKYDLTTGSETQLTDLDTIDSFPSWSKDGKKILFLSARDQGTYPEAFVMNADGSNPTNLSKRGKFEEYVSWSLKDNYILLSSFRDERYSNIYRMNVDGSEQIRIAAAKGFQSQPLARPYLLTGVAESNRSIK